MTRISCLTASACLALVVTALGCNDSSGVAPDGGGTGQGGASAQGGAVGTGGASGAAGHGSGGVTGTGGGAGATGTGGTAVITGAAGATGAAGTKGAAGATGAAGTKGAAGATGAAGAKGAAGAPGVAGVSGTAGTAGAKGTAGAGGGGLICQADQACTDRQECQTDCSGGADSHSTFCTCADQGGGGLTLACVSLPCSGRDAAVNDGGPIFHDCAAGLKDGDNCDPGANTLCQSVCTADTQMRCLCVPHGGGGGGKWTCTPGIACL